LKFGFYANSPQPLKGNAVELVEAFCFNLKILIKINQNQSKSIKIKMQIEIKKRK